MKIAVIGAGSWGTALALGAHRAGNEVLIYSRNQEISQQINMLHKNSNNLADIDIPQEIIATDKLAEVLDYEILLLVVPAQTIRSVCLSLAKLELSSNKILVICAKGIEQDSFKLMSEVVEEILPNNKIAILSGPNFAHEVALGLPAISSLAASDIDLSQKLSTILTSENFRVYANNDIIGTQIFGAAKNVLAIATGIVIGKKFGENAKSAIISRGIYEINALVGAKGGDEKTLLSPAGIGDINLTCNSSTSRNTAYGIALAEGEIVSGGQLVEGFYTSKSIAFLAKSLGVEMPICKAIYEVAHNEQSIDKIIKELLNRPLLHN